MAHHENKGHSQACCNTPPVTAQYTDKGSYQDINGLKTYVTGDSSATQGIIIIYDIFGFSAQGNQGADILSSADENKKYQVFIPDLLKGKFADLSWFPPDTEEKSKKLGGLFSGPANPQTNTPEFIKWSAELAKAHPEVKKWGIVGFCWGGKILTLGLAKTEQFSAAASVHPAMVDSKDAEGVKVPMIILPSKDEDIKAVREFASKLKVENEVEHFEDQIHGFMGARGDLKDEKVKNEYKRGYETVLQWFHKYL